MNVELGTPNLELPDIPLTQFMGLRRINTRGIANANKVMLCAAMAYNLKKYLKFTRNRAESVAKAAQAATSSLLGHIWVVFGPYPTLIF